MSINKINKTTFCEVYFKPENNNKKYQLHLGN